MERLSKLIERSEDWLVDRVLYYAKETGYVKYTSTLKEAWRISISGLSYACMHALSEDNPLRSLGPDINYDRDPVTYFGTIEAQKHRERGIPLEMFLGLLKYYRQCYIALIHDAGFEHDYEKWCSLFIQHFFDRIEISICKEWTISISSNDLQELQHTNRIMTNEKNKYLTIFESSPNPIIFFDKESKIESMNFAASKLLLKPAVPGSGYYGEKTGLSLPEWLESDIKEFIDSKSAEYSFEKDMGDKGFYNIKLKRMLDVSEKFMGTVLIFNDITREKLVEQALEESRDFFLKLLDDFPALVWKSGIDGRCDYFNSKWLDFTGRSPKQEINLGWLEGVYADDREYCLNTYMEAFNKRQSFEMEYRLRRYDGTYKWIRDIGRPFKNTDGNFAGYIGSCYDITERKEAETILNRYKLLSENTRDIILFVSKDGHIVEANSAAANVYGFSREELLSMTIYDLRADEDKSRINEDMKSAEHTGILFEAFHRKKDNSTFPVEVSSRGVIIDGEPILLSIIRDITERKEAEEKLKDANQKLLDIIEFLPDATFVVDSNSNVIAWNLAMEELTGLKNDNALGRGHYEYASALYGMDISILTDYVITGEKAPVNQYEYVQKKGNYLYAEGFAPAVYGGKGAYIWGVASPIYDSKGNIIGAIESIRDITDRKNMEKKLKDMSMYDSLTGLYNRAYFEMEMQHLENSGCSSASLVISDIDSLKTANDEMGHSAGDGLLVSVADILKNSFPKEAIVARIDGDEFAVLVTNMSKGSIEDTILKIRRAILNYNETNSEVNLSISIGFSARTDTSKRMDALYKEAENAMQKDKTAYSKSSFKTIISS